MWIWLGIIFVIIVCAVVAAAIEDDKEQKEEELEKIADTRSAKFPEVFKELFSEEYPQHSDDLTFVKSDQFIKKWQKTSTSKEFKKYLNFKGTEFKNENARSIGAHQILKECASVISPDFSAHAIENPVETYERIEAIIESTSTKVKGI